MRFCPFCSAESADDATTCQACSRRLPPATSHRRTTSSEANARRPSDAIAADAPQAVDNPDAPQVVEAGNDDATASEYTAPTARSTPGLAPKPRAHTTPPPSFDDDWGAPEQPTQADASGDAPEVTQTASADSPSTPAFDDTSPAPARIAPTQREPAQTTDIQTDGNRASVAANSTLSTRQEAPSSQAQWRTTQQPRAQQPRAHQPVDIERPPVVPMPDLPGPGILDAAKYAMAVTRARWQRRSARKTLERDNERDRAEIERAIHTLGEKARELDLRDPVLAKENQAIDHAEDKRADIERACDEISNRKAEEDSAFASIEAEHRSKESRLEAERDAIQREIDDLEARRRGAEDKLDTVRRQQRGYLRAAEQRDEQAGRAPMGESRSALRRASEDLRRDAAILDTEKNDLERRLAELERPLSQAMAKKETIVAKLDDARSALRDARDTYKQQLSELEDKQNERSKELSDTEADIGRHLTTLGTLVNLHRLEHEQLSPLYRHIDDLRSAIGARSTESDRLDLERDTYDRESHKRGYLLIGAVGVGVFLFILLLIAI